MLSVYNLSLSIVDQAGHSPVTSGRAGSEAGPAPETARQVALMMKEPDKCVVWEARSAGKQPSKVYHYLISLFSSFSSSSSSSSCVRFRYPSHSLVYSFLRSLSANLNETLVKTQNRQFFSISKYSCPAHCLLTWEKRIYSSTTVSGQHTQNADASEANSHRIIWANSDKTEISNKAIIHEETYCNQSKHIFYVFVEPNELATTNGLINGVNIIGFLLVNKRV